MPQQIGLRLALPTRPQSGNDLPELRMERRFGQLAGLYMGAQAAELAALALAPIVNDELDHDVGQRQLDGAHRPVRHDKGARLDPRRLQERRRLGEARGLDDDVSALDASLPILCGNHGLAEFLAQPFRKTATTFLAARVNPDFIEIKEMIEQAHVPISGPPRADM